MDESREKESEESRRRSGLGSRPAGALEGAKASVHVCEASARGRVLDGQSIPIKETGDMRRLRKKRMIRG